MKSFKNYIIESRMTTREEIVAAITGHKKAGEILNPVYQDLGSQARRIFGKETDAGREAILASMRKGERDATLTDIYYSWPHDSFVSLGKIDKLASKLKPEFKAVAAIAHDLVKKWKPVADDLKALKGMVVKVTQKRAEAKVVAASNMNRKFADSSSLIKIFESHMQEYIDMAKKRSEEFVKDKLDILKKHGMDLDKVAPRPNSRTMGASDYKSAQAKRDLYRSFVKPVSDTHRAGDPYIVKANQVMIDRYVELNVKGAEDAYKKFMGKMIEKIGKPVVDAKMTGNIWTNATLHVTTDDGEEQVWSTQMIINFSKYQTMFNQFPSRRKK